MIKNDQLNQSKNLYKIVDHSLKIFTILHTYWLILLSCVLTYLS